MQKLCGKRLSCGKREKRGEKWRKVNGGGCRKANAERIQYGNAAEGAVRAGGVRSESLIQT